MQPDPGSCQVQKTQEPSRVFIIAAPAFEPAEIPCYGVARWVPFRGGAGVRAPVPGRNDGLDAPLRPPRAEGVAVVGPVGDQAGQRRVRPGFHQGPGLSAVVALAARHVQAQGTVLGSVRMWIWGLKPPRLRPSAFVLGRACRADVRALTVLSCHTADRSGWPAGRPSGAARRPDRADGHSGDRPISTFRTRSATAAKGCPTAPLGIGHRGPSARRWGQGIALWGG